MVITQRMGGLPQVAQMARGTGSQVFGLRLLHCPAPGGEGALFMPPWDSDPILQGLRPRPVFCVLALWSASPGAAQEGYAWHLQLFVE